MYAMASGRAFICIQCDRDRPLGQDPCNAADGCSGEFAGVLGQLNTFAAPRDEQPRGTEIAPRTLRKAEGGRKEGEGRERRGGKHTHAAGGWRAQ